MRRAFPCIVLATTLCALCAGADHKTWKMIHYIGGTLPIKTSRYDWNTTLTVTSDEIVVEIAPATVFGAKETVRFKPSQVLSLSHGEAAWQHVAAVDGARLQVKPPTLFGLTLGFEMFGIVYDTDSGKRGAMLFDGRFSAVILRVLSKLTGKPIESSP
jgi:hypothetical protein